MKVEERACLAKTHVVAKELSLTSEVNEVNNVKIKFLDELREQLESRSENTEMIYNFAALNLRRVSPDTVTLQRAMRCPSY